VAELAGAKPIRARAHLLVTVPVYMNWWSSANTTNTNGSPSGRQ